MEGLSGLLLLFIDVPLIWTDELLMWICSLGRRQIRYRRISHILFYRKGETPREFFIPLFLGFFFWIGLLWLLFIAFGPFRQIHEL